jgi:hypothetical protein
MMSEDLYEIVYEAVRQAMADEGGGTDLRMARRLVGGAVLFRDNEGRTVKEVDTFVFFRKVTSVREKLRVLEQKINNHAGLSPEDKAELQGAITRCYGSLTTFNFLFHEDEDKFQGTAS